ncbi:acyltransferase family protein [Castellaniella caeni]
MKSAPPLQNPAHKVKHLGLKYRPDIDGLRALAVLAVVIYHYAPGKFPGGFIGVDLFFVISGYLITGILLKAFETHSFSLLDFYQRRIKRIFPALAAILLFCLIAGWLLLFASEFAALGKHMAAGAGFVQNLVLWREAGYFDVSALHKPLLHLWSLAVEEQFYIVWPLTLWLVLRWRWHVTVSILVFAGLSFALNLWGVASDHTIPTFYLPVTRAWELMAGAALAAWHHPHGRRDNTPMSHSSSILGLALIVLGFIFTRPDRGFPGLWGLLPVTGAALLIYAGPTAFINQRALSLKPVVWMGLISYPLYLWHWVLWSLAAMVTAGADLFVLRIIKLVAFPLSLALAWVTYRYLEQPIRTHGGLKTSKGLVIAVTALGLGGLAINLTGGLAQRPLSLINPHAKQLLASMDEDAKAPKCFNLIKGATLAKTWSCELGDPQAKRWIMAYGDSHARSLIPALDTYGRQQHIRVVFSGISGCPALLGISILDGRDKVEGPACLELARRAAALADENHAAGVVLVQRWSYYLGGTTKPDEHIRVQTKIQAHDDGGNFSSSFAAQAVAYGLKTTVTRYYRLGIPVLLLKDNPQQPAEFPSWIVRFGNTINLAALNRASVTLAEHARNQGPANRLLEAIARQYPNVRLLNSDAALCNASQCPWFTDGKSLYFDDDHLSITGAMRVYPLLAQALDGLLHIQQPQ